MGLKYLIEKFELYFMYGGKLEKYYLLYEVVVIIFYMLGQVICGVVYVCDVIDLKWMMIFVWFVVFLVMFWGMYNVGLQIILVLYKLYGVEQLQQVIVNNWYYSVVQWLGVSFSVDVGWLSMMILGVVFFLFIYFIVFIVGGFWEVLFVIVCKYEINEGFFVIFIFFVLIVLFMLLLWQVVLGIFFGVVIVKEIFGGIGCNFFNLVLVGCVFLFFVYLVQIFGDFVWIVVDGFFGVMLFFQWVSGGGEVLVNVVIGVLVSWMDVFFGNIFGLIGEVLMLMIFIGGVIIFFGCVVFWCIVVGVMIGMIVIVILFNVIGFDINLMFVMLWYWYLVFGGFVFGMMFMVMDLVFVLFIDKGKWSYGVLIGVMCVLICVVNLVYLEGMMLVIFFVNFFVLLFDYLVVQVNIKWRKLCG